MLPEGGGMRLCGDKTQLIAYWAALRMPTFCTVLQVLLLNYKLLGDLVRKAEK
jgi:hypothetical protein